MEIKTHLDKIKLAELKLEAVERTKKEHRLKYNKLLTEHLNLMNI